MWEHFGNDNFTRIIGQENGRKSEYWGELSTGEPEARGPTLVGVLSSLAVLRHDQSYCDGSCELRAAPPLLAGAAQLRVAAKFSC